MNEEKNDIDMIFNGSCPHCGGDLVVKFVQPVPSADIVSPDDIDKPRQVDDYEIKENDPNDIA